MGGILRNVGVDSVAGLMKGAGQFAKDVRATVTGQEVLGPEDKLKIIHRWQGKEITFDPRKGLFWMREGAFFPVRR